MKILISFASWWRTRDQDEGDGDGDRNEGTQVRGNATMPEQACQGGGRGRQRQQAGELESATDEQGRMEDRRHDEAVRRDDAEAENWRDKRMRPSPDNTAMATEHQPNEARPLSHYTNATSNEESDSPKRLMRGPRQEPRGTEEFADALTSDYV